MKVLSEIQALQIKYDNTNTDAVIDVGGLLKKRDLSQVFLSSVTVELPSIFNPVTATASPGSSTLTYSLKSQTRHHVFAAPNTANGTPSFRALLLDDISDYSQAAVNYWTKTGDDLYYDSGNVSIGANSFTGQALGVHTSEPLVARWRQTAIGGDAITRYNAYNNAGTQLYADILFDPDNYSFEFKVPYTTASRFTIKSTGYIGAGTTTPVLPFDIAQNALNPPATSGTTRQGMMRIGYSNHTWGGSELNFGIINVAGTSYPAWLQAQQPDDLSISRPLLLNPNGGNVGVGTFNPQYKFVVSNGGSIGLEIDTGIVDSNTISLFSYDRSTSNYKNMRFYGVDFAWYYGGTRIANLSNSGTLTVNYSGSGTATRLDVKGAIKQNAAINGVVYADANGVFWSKGFGADGTVLVADSTSDGGLQWVSASSFSNSINYWSKTGTSLYYQGGVVGIGNVWNSTYNTSPLYVIQHSNTQYVTTLANGGGEGLGLSISAGSASSSTIPLRISLYDNTELFRINGFGRIGLGTNNPLANFHIYGTGAPEIRIQDGDGTNQYAGIGHNGGATNYVSRNNTSNGVHVWYGYDGTTFSPFMTLSASGYLGVGTTNPIHKIHSYTSGTYNMITSEGDGGSGYIESGFLSKSTNGGRGAGYFTQNSISNWFIGNPYSASDSFIISRQAGVWNASTAADANGFLKISSQGYFGLGTMSPIARLHVYSVAQPVVFQSSSATGLNYLSFRNNAGLETAYIGQGSSGNNGLYYYIPGNENQLFYTNGAARFAITGDGWLYAYKYAPASNKVVLGVGTAGDIQALSSADIASILGTGHFIQNQIGTAQTGNFWVSGESVIGNTKMSNAKLTVAGGHVDAIISLYSNNGVSNNTLDMWASEPGLSYNGVGIGANVSIGPWYGRRNASLAQSYVRFYEGNIYFAASETETLNPSSDFKMKIETTGKVTIRTTTASKFSLLDVGLYTSDGARIGHSAIGLSDYTGYASLSHTSMQGTGQYALLQSSLGDTFLNAASGREIYFRINNSTAAKIASNARFRLANGQINYKVAGVDANGEFKQATLTDITDAMGYIPASTTALNSYALKGVTLTINGTAYDLSANRSWTISSGLWSDGSGFIYRSGNAVIGSASRLTSNIYLSSARVQVSGSLIAYNSGATEQFTYLAPTGVTSSFTGGHTTTMSQASTTRGQLTTSTDNLALGPGAIASGVSVVNINYLRTVYVGEIDNITNNSYRMYVDSDTVSGDGLYVKGKIYTTDTVTFGSDRNLKSEIEEIANPLEALRQMKGYSYRFRNQGKQLGFIAQDVQKVFPFLVGKSDGHLTLNYNAMTALVAASVLALDKKQEDHEKRIKRLEKENNEKDQIIAELRKLFAKLDQ